MRKKANSLQRSRRRGRGRGNRDRGRGRESQTRSLAGHGPDALVLQGPAKGLAGAGGSLKEREGEREGTWGGGDEK